MNWGSKHECITQHEIQQAREHYHIGDVIRIHTYKVQDAEALSRLPVIRKAKIVDKYQHFALVELSCGIRDSVLWTDLIRRTKKIDGKD